MAKLYYRGMAEENGKPKVDCQITEVLEAVQDSATHVSILPKATMLLEKYEAALASTQNDWQKV